MADEMSGSEKAVDAPRAGAAAASVASCRKKKSEVDEGFLKDLRAHIDEFVNASFDEHKTCLQKSLHKLFGASRTVDKQASLPAPVDSVLPLRVNTFD